MRPERIVLALAFVLAVVIVVGGASAAGQAPSAGPGYKQVGKWGKSGTANSQFRGPFGIATDKSGTVFVADTDNDRIQVFSASGRFLRKWGTTGSGSGQFLSAQDVAIDPTGVVWVADYRNNRVQRFSSGGAFQAEIAVSGVSGVAVDAAGNLFVHDLNGRVTRYDKASDYAQAASWKAGGRGGDIEVGADGTVYTSDTAGTPSVKIFDSAGKAKGAIRGGLSTPIGAGVDLDCNVWVGQISARRFAKFSPKGRLLGTVSTGDVVPEDIAVGPKGDLYALGQTEVVRFAEDKAKPGTANVPATVKVSGGTAKISYTLSGVACPTEVGATATLTGPGIAGKAAGLKLKAGAKNTITMKLSKAASGKATFKIVLKTNGRPTTETKVVSVSAR
jgi:sugar lactone lactonase YvrE